MAEHPELVVEQAYIDHAYDCLEENRRKASRLQGMVEVGRGGTDQARWEREVITGSVLGRLAQLDLGDQSLCFGRIDRLAEAGGETYYIGRIAVADRDQEPVVVDWRAPVAEPFYRATGRQPMDLRRRRHFATRGRTLLGLEDERVDGASVGTPSEELVGKGALIAALETARTGRLTDIVATIQAEQDEVIRSELHGVLVVQGGPGTGKSVVALHRAAYLLYTHRFPLEGQGVLVVGPNRLFLGYIEQVLPSLGEAGVQLAVLADLVPDVTVSGRDAPAVAALKADTRMGRVVAKAVRDRERPLRADLEVGYGRSVLRLSADRSAEIVTQARRRFRTHNAGRRFVERELFRTLATGSRVSVDPGDLQEALRGERSVREALEWMWPVLRPAELLRDLYGSRPLLRSAGARHFGDDMELLFREREGDLASVTWTHDDVPVLDEAVEVLGPLPGEDDEAEVRTFGHIVVDEVQDRSPMELRMLARRSLNGSMTVVGDIAQATGAWPHENWDQILAHLPDRRPARRVELTIGYRIPEPLLEPARRVLAVAAPELSAPDAVRREGDPPRWVETKSHVLTPAVVEAVLDEREGVGPGSIAVVCPASMAEELTAGLEEEGLDVGRATTTGLRHQVTVVPVALVKGLEVDAAVVVEPARIIEEEPQGLRSLYVALTRATKRLAVVHAEPLPEILRGERQAAPQ